MVLNKYSDSNANSQEKTLLNVNLGENLLQPVDDYLEKANAPPNTIMTDESEQVFLSDVLTIDMLEGKTLILLGVSDANFKTPEQFQLNESQILSNELSLEFIVANGKTSCN